MLCKQYGLVEIDCIDLTDLILVVHLYIHLKGYYATESCAKCETL
jgi:hypothetical protein